MTQIKIEVPANDHIALSAMAEALQRIAAERTPSVTVGEPVHLDSIPKGHSAACKEYYGSNTEQLNAELEHASQPVDADEETKDFSVPENYEESIANFHTSPRSADEPETEQDDTLDADGLPWDKRIHSRGKTRLSDDTWRLARKPNDKTDEEWSAYVDSVKSELKAVQDIPVTPPEVDEPTADVETREGPFYWSHNESDSCGKVETIEELHAMIDGDGLVEQISKDDYDHFVTIGYDNGVNKVTPPTAPTLTPPVVDEPAVQMEGVTPNGDVAIEPPVTTTGAPVAPVTPPTSLTPPVVEPTEAPSDQPSVTTFQELMLYITGNAKKRGADNDMIKATLAEVDPALTAIPLIATRADLIPKFVTALEAKLS